MARTCGECALCCKVLRVDELQKPCNVWCQFAKPGRTGACDIYDTRPNICREFECLWLQAVYRDLDGSPFLTDSMRPDKLKAVLTMGKDGETLLIHEDPAYRGQARQRLRPLIEYLNAHGHAVIVACGQERTMFQVVGGSFTYDEDDEGR